MDALTRFRIEGRRAVITGGAGLLGYHHACAVAEAGGIPVLWDIDAARLERQCARVAAATGAECLRQRVDITAADQVRQEFTALLQAHPRVDILINNAANDPKVSAEGAPSLTRLENFPLAAWEQDVAVGLTGSFLCSQIIGTHMAAAGGGVILNICSDLAVIAPDQRIYRRPGLKDGEQPAKPVTYSVIKHGLLGLTRYLATYWAEAGVRVNALSPGGVYTGQPEDFVERLSQLIPMGRMAAIDEYKSAVLFLVSDASSYMTGSNMVVDGGRTCW